MMQQRRDEIQAKRDRLAELKRARQERTNRDSSINRTGSPGEVANPPESARDILTYLRYYPLHLDEEQKRRK
jgi:hypothetical protein